jgi:hypothetical protein
MSLLLLPLMLLLLLLLLLPLLLCFSRLHHVQRVKSPAPRTLHIPLSARRRYEPCP